MPNIIEQQDLLKGLPNTRLAMLLQNPTGDIPLFLVAAEAQRRQALAQQFAGSEGKESVVDTLTKQLANVPQNIPAPTRSPPMIPQTPQMQGVAALQAQQSAQQMAQPQEGQMMRSGGMVQRYQYGGQVQPWWQIPDLSNTFSGITGYLGEKIGDLSEFATMPYAERLNNNPTVESLASSVTGNNATGNFDVFPPAVVNPEMYNGGSGSDLGLPDIPVGPNSPEARRSREEQLRLKKQYLEYAASQTPPEPGETQDEYRARLEKILAVQEPSNSEKAGKYYDMAAAFLDPSKTTMESIAAAGQAFSRASAEQARAEREARIGLERGLLEYDIGKAEDARREKEREAEIKSSALKAKTEVATTQINGLYRQSDQIDDNLRRKIDAAKNQGLSDSEIAALPEIMRDNELLSDIQKRIANLQSFLDTTYGMPQMPTVDTKNRTIR
jgi:hypothetical protein